MPVSRMTNLRANDTWKMKIFNAPCRERSIKMKGQAVSSSFVSARWTFFISMLVFFLDGGRRGKIFWRLWWFMLKTKVPCCHNLCTQMLSLTKALMLWEKSRPSLHGRNPEKCWVRGSRWDQSRWVIPTGTVLQSLFLLPPPFPLEMFLLHLGEWWASWFHSEIICFRRRKRSSLGQTKRIS